MKSQCQTNSKLKKEANASTSNDEEESKIKRDKNGSTLKKGCVCGVSNGGLMQHLFWLHLKPGDILLYHADMFS
jgi:hypothetical protein